MQLIRNGFTTMLVLIEPCGIEILTYNERLNKRRMF